MSTCISLWISCTTTKTWPNLSFFPLLEQTSLKVPSSLKLRTFSLTFSRALWFLGAPSWPTTSRSGRRPLVSKYIVEVDKRRRWRNWNVVIYSKLKHVRTLATLWGCEGSSYFWGRIHSRKAFNLGSSIKLWSILSPRITSLVEPVEAVQKWISTGTVNIKQNSCRNNSVAIEKNLILGKLDAFLSA